MDILNTVPAFDAATHYMTDAFTDAPDPERNRTVRRWHVEPIPLDEIKAIRKLAVTAKRYEVETGSITIGGTVIRTDRESQGMINGAYSLARDMIDGLEPPQSIDFKADGAWATIQPDVMVQIGRAVGRHVQACFRIERALHAAIDAAGPEAADVLAVDISTGWP